MATGTMSALAKELKAAKDEKERLEDLAKANEKEISRLEGLLITEMASEGLESFKNELGTFRPKDETYWSIPADNREAAHLIIAEVEPDILKQSVHPKTLSGYMNELEKNPEQRKAKYEELKGLLTSFTKHKIAIYPARGKAEVEAAE